MIGAAPLRIWAIMVVDWVRLVVCTAEPDTVSLSVVWVASTVSGPFSHTSTLDSVIS